MPKLPPHSMEQVATLERIASTEWDIDIGPTTCAFQNSAYNTPDQGLNSEFGYPVCIFGRILLFFGIHVHVTVLGSGVGRSHGPTIM